MSSPVRNRSGQKRSKPTTPPSPSLKNDGIALDRLHLPRYSVVDKIYNTAKNSQHVVIGSPAGTGKTSLIQLLQKKLRDEGANVIRLNMSSAYAADYYITKLREKQIDPADADSLENLQNTWLLLDDAQRAYTEDFNRFWESVVKDIGGADAKGLFVVIAATYDLSTPESPACFKPLEHVDAYINESEARELLQMHYSSWGYGDWEEFRSTQLKMSALLPLAEPPLFHVGVIMAGILMLNQLRKNANQLQLTEQMALVKLRHRAFIPFLKRCFALGNLPEGYKDQLLDAVIGKNEFILAEDAILGPFLRAGVLNEKGNFTCMAATWFYNDQCFPNRSLTTPADLDSLVRNVVSILSAKRLSDTLENGFPKEATFQHLFNEAMSQLLKVHNKVIPELNTQVTPTHGSNGTGELDFYINGNLKWCLELLRMGDKIGNHLERFNPLNGRYRNVEMNDYLVVDCRGPKVGSGVQANASRCTLYFSSDFKKCLCKMRLEEEIWIDLAN